MSFSQSKKNMDTLPMGFHLVEMSAPDAEAETARRNLSLLVARVAHSSSFATGQGANFEALLQAEAVERYMKEADNPSESMDDPVMILLEKAAFLKSLRSSFETNTA